MIDKLNYGYTFQTKVLASILTRQTFLSQVYDILKPEYFENVSLQKIITWSKEYFIEYMKLPSLDVIKIRLENEIGDTNKSLKVEIINDLREAFSIIDKGYSDSEYIEEEVINFCRNQELKSAIMDSVELLKDRKYDAIKELIDNALKKGIVHDIGDDYVQTVEQRYNESKRSPIKTGWEIINDVTSGGLAPGELGIIVGPSGSGKSWLLMHLAAAAAKEGKTVFYYTLELDKSYTGRRIDSIMTGIDLDSLQFQIEDIKKRLKTIKGKIIIQQYPTKGVSLNGIVAHIQKNILMGIIPDMIVLDYADLLEYEIGKQQRTDEALKTLYERMRGLAGTFNIPFWSASQGNRSSSQLDIVQADSISEAFSKIFTCDFVMSISRRAKDKEENTARIHIMKNRFGPDGLTFPAFVDLSKGHIQIYNDESKKGKELNNKMVNDEVYYRKEAAKTLEVMQKARGLF